VAAQQHSTARKDCVVSNNKADRLCAFPLGWRWWVLGLDSLWHGTGTGRRIVAFGMMGEATRGWLIMLGNGVGRGGDFAGQTNKCTTRVMHDR
jgi:hypothetical protein